MLFGVWLEPLFKVYPYSWLLTGFIVWFPCMVLFAHVECCYVLAGEDFMKREG
jgi:hypothetical protein